MAARNCQKLSILLTIIAIFSLLAFHIANTNPFHVCAHSPKPVSCFAIVAKEAVVRASSKSELELLQLLLNRSLAQVDVAEEMARNMSLRSRDMNEVSGLLHCVKQMELSRFRLEASSSLASLGPLSTQSHADMHTWVSAVLTNYVTCTDALANSTAELTPLMAQLEQLISLASTTLAVIVAISPTSDNERGFMESQTLPSWLAANDVKLLRSPTGGIKANVVVAKDGSGKYKTVREAVASAPNHSKSRYIIYVKKGIYKEIIEVGKAKKNLMIVGDGLLSTIIAGNLNSVDTHGAFNTSTFTILGDGFIAQDLCFKNTAGPAKGQAVALYVQSDRSVINRCGVFAYQDTLLAHSLRQFYRDTYIGGTVDYVFGNAAVVFQNCTLIARRPLSQQKNMVTAQGRTDPNQNTATSIQKSRFLASKELQPAKGTVQSYLGRPWKEYSRTVVMQSYIGDHISPAGWSPWNQSDFALKTLYYGEYSNYGPRGDTSKRVRWPGYHVITKPKEAMKFTVGKLIQGRSWLKSTGVHYKEGL